MLVSYMPLAPAALQSAAVAVIRVFGRSAGSASIHCSGALSTSHAWHSYLAIMHGTMRLLLAAIAQCSAISAAGKLRSVLRAPGAVVCPGVHDALSTKVFAEAGAQVPRSVQSMPCEAHRQHQRCNHAGAILVGLRRECMPRRAGCGYSHEGRDGGNCMSVRPGRRRRTAHCGRRHGLRRRVEPEADGPRLR